MINKLMVVAHPDDETLWGWRAFESDSWLVVCVTNCGQERKKKFLQAVEVFGATGLSLDLPDAPSRDFTLDETEFLINSITDILKQENIETVVTHSAGGEYGHPVHKSISRIISSLVPQEKLKYFNFQDEPPLAPETLSFKRQKALQIYFGYLESINSFKLQECLNQQSNNTISPLRVLGKLISFISKKLPTLKEVFSTPSTTFFDGRACEITDLIHIEMSLFAVIEDSVKSGGQITFLSSPPPPKKNRSSLILAKSQLYYTYHDRRYLALEYYPSCLGKTLNVGVHEFNQLDWLFVGNPEGFETLELEEKYSKFGSPFKHTTGDFLNFNPDYEFQDIVLFGVLGIPQDPRRDSDTYSLFNKETSVINKADELLQINGRLVLGPDLKLDARKSRKRNLKFWKDFLITNNTLQKHYLIEFKLETESNFLVVLRKLS